MFFRYAVGVHRRVDIYSIESAGIEYSIDMKVNFVVIRYNLLICLILTQVLSIPRPAPQRQSLGQMLGKE